MVSAILKTTKATGEFLTGAGIDAPDMAITGVWNLPGQVMSSFKYAMGVDRYVEEDRPWSKVGTGYRGHFWQGDNGLTRLSQRIKHAAVNFTLSAVNTVGMGLPYYLVNQKMGIDCPYFFPGPSNPREYGRFFSSGIAVMLMGRQLIVTPVALPTEFPTEPIPVFVEPPAVVAYGPLRSSYALPSAAEELATLIRQGDGVALSVLRQMLNARVPSLLDPITQATVVLSGEGYIPIHLFETLLWETHLRTAYLWSHLNATRVLYPRLEALWQHYNLDAYMIEALPSGDAQLVPVYRPSPPRPALFSAPPTYN